MGVAIIGGGLAGAINALQLLHRGVDDVRILEAKTSGGTTLCGEGISDRTLRRLDPVFDSRPFIDTTFAGARWRFPGTSVWIHRACHTMARETWIPAMLDAAADRGATVEYGVRGQVDKLDETVVIGADGPGSKTRRHVEGADVRLRTGHQVRFKTDAHTDWLEFVTSKAFGPEYAWWFPRQATHNIGILGAGDGQDDARLDAFIAHMGLEGSIVKREAFPIAFGGRRFVSHDGRVLLTGDAAGLTNPLTKGGMASIIYAAERLAGAVSRGRPKDYQRIARHPISDPLFAYGLRTVERTSDERFRRLLAPVAGDIHVGGPAPTPIRAVGARMLSRRPWLAAQAWRMYGAARGSLNYSW